MEFYHALLGLKENQIMIRKSKSTAYIKFVAYQDNNHVLVAVSNKMKKSDLICDDWIIENE